MNIAVIFTKDADEGGSFQFALSTSLLLEKNNSEKYNFIFFTTSKNNIKIFAHYNLVFNYLPWSDVDRLISQLFCSQLISNIVRKLKIKSKSKFDRVLEKHNIDLVYFLNPSDLSSVTAQYNYILTVWDLCFRDFMEFPEVREEREFERREKLYRAALGKAMHIIADSEFTKKSIMKRYAIDEERISILPLTPSISVKITEQEYLKNYVDIHKKYNVDGKYIFYPAQLWPHKNHIYILKGLKILKEKYDVKIHAIFSGSDKGNLKFVLKKAKEFGISEQVHYIGFVDDKEMPYLYRQALALVMPTYFGPTNMPPLEAFKLGCPVLYSDLTGLREQVEGAAILLDLKKPESLCGGILKIINKSPEIGMLIENGKKKNDSLLCDEKQWWRLKNIFDDYVPKMECWK